MIFNQRYIYKMVFTVVFGVLGLQQANAQDDDEQNLGTEVVNVVKPYTPTISDAFKVKATPVLNDSVTTAKKKVTYSIFSVPVASTFTPAKGKAASVKKVKREKLYDNYATLGFGSYTSVLAEFYSNFQISRTEDFGVFLNHNSSQGNIDGIQADDYFYDTRLNLNYGARERDMSWRTDLDVKHQIFNWYGVDSVFSPSIENPTAGIDHGSFDPAHTYTTFGLNGSLNFDDGFFKGGKATVRRFGDSEGSGEIRAFVKPTLEFPIAGEIITTTLTADYVGGNFEAFTTDGEETKYNILNAGLSPSLVILRDDLTVNLGVGAFVSVNSADDETDVDIFFYPRVTASYRVAGEFFIAYAGLEGDLHQNSYYEFAQENPFISPNQIIAPTDKQFDGYLGMKGKLSENASYNLRAGYRGESNKALYRLNNFTTPIAGEGNREAFNYGNSFGIVYDDVNTISVFGELNFDVSQNFKMRINGEYNNYSTDVEEEAWNLPDLKASVFGDYQITEQWFAGINLFFVGERLDQRGVINPIGIFDESTITLESYFDANAHLGYRFNDRLSAFGRVNNILSNNYEKWTNYPVQGIQALVGATYKFDF